MIEREREGRRIVFRESDNESKSKIKSSEEERREKRENTKAAGVWKFNKVEGNYSEEEMLKNEEEMLKEWRRNYKTKNMECLKMEEVPKEQRNA